MADFDCFCQFTGHTVDFTIQWLNPIQNGGTNVTMIITYFWKESIMQGAPRVYIDYVRIFSYYESIR